MKAECVVTTDLPLPEDRQTGRRIVVEAFAKDAS
jgi:hypothetical protein